MIDGSTLSAAIHASSYMQTAAQHGAVGGIVPNGLFDVLTLAGIIVFFITSISAILSSIFVKKDNLLYLGTQLILLSVCLYLSSHWTYRAWFSDLFGDLDQQIRVVDTMIFVSIAYTLDVGLKVIVWDGILARHGRKSVPPLLVGSTRVLIYLFAFLVILQFVFNKSITALAALSGALAVILGLSAQSTLGEMFAGIAIALSRPFRIGDWVKIGTLDEGRVIDMTWRMVRIETTDKIVLNVPNRTAADQTVRNFSHPNPTVRITQTICFAQSENPMVLQELVDKALASTKGIMADPKPYALFRGARDGVSEYSMRYYIDDYKDKDRATENVWKSVLEHVARSDFKIAIPRRVLEVHSETLPSQSA